jgi:hypothetical protein
MFSNMLFLFHLSIKMVQFSKSNEAARSASRVGSFAEVFATLTDPLSGDFDSHGGTLRGDLPKK